MANEATLNDIMEAIVGLKDVYKRQLISFV